jgi:hypothetical protein
MTEDRYGGSGFTGGGACGGEERVWGLEWVKGQPQGLWVSFYRARRGRGGDSRGNGHQWPKGAPAGLDCIKRGGV